MHWIKLANSHFCAHVYAQHHIVSFFVWYRIVGTYQSAGALLTGPPINNPGYANISRLLPILLLGEQWHDECEQFA